MDINTVTPVEFGKSKQTNMHSVVGAAANWKTNHNTAASDKIQEVNCSLTQQ